MRLIRPLMRLVCALLLSAVGLVRAAPDAYVAKDTWQETCRLSHEKLAALLEKENAESAAIHCELSVWYRLPPLKADGKKGFKTAFAPIKGVDLERPCDGKTWEKAPGYADGTVHSMKAPGGYATFLFRTIKTDEPRKLPIYLGSDDALGVWLNGESVLMRDVKRGPGPDQDRAVLDLKAGENELLLMIYNYLGGHGFYFALQPSKDAARRQGRDRLWQQLQNDFTSRRAMRQMEWERGDGIWTNDWPAGDLKSLARRYVDRITDPKRAAAAEALIAGCETERDLDAIRDVYYLDKGRQEAQRLAAEMNLPALRRAVNHLSRTYPKRYPGAAMAADLEALEQRLETTAQEASEGIETAIRALPDLRQEADSLRRRALLANPDLDIDRILMVRRKGSEGLPQNWQGNDRLHRQRFDNAIATFQVQDGTASVKEIYRPPDPIFVGDVDLHYDADRMMFSTNGTVCEVGVDGSGFRKVITAIESYDPCYLPDGRILFVSNSGYHAVPCVSGSDYVGNLHIAHADGTAIRRLCFDQDNNWYPTMLPNGRVLYTRWEYTDSAHYFSRVLMHMNPDGTNQVEFYGSNSYWPNSMFYARPLPGSCSRFVAIVSGHHGPARMGELVLFDASRDRHEAGGAVQKIPGYGKPVKPVIKDNLVGSVWPKFLHPYPLTDKVFLVSCRMTARDDWAIYLVDVFDNMVPLCKLPGEHCFEPIPLRKRPRPPVVADRVRPQEKEATVYIADMYAGKGLRGVPRGTVKDLRVVEYDYAYRNTGGHYVVGYEGPWDIHRIHGTVPVLEDGSAVFKIPANTPLYLQPLDEEGKALAQMRSWFVGMPGEFLSCVGCHEKQNSVPPSRQTMAAQRPPQKIEPWYGPARGFSFRREVQPVLDKYCVGCHDGSQKNRPNLKDDGDLVSFPTAQSAYTKPYVALHPYVRRNGPEGDYHTLTPLEFHADTSELIQILEKGHHGVSLDPESWDRLITWIDLNVPCHGTWKEATRNRVKQEYLQKRREHLKAYANIDIDPEAIVNPYQQSTDYVVPEKPADTKKDHKLPDISGWPFDARQAQKLQGSNAHRDIQVDEGVTIALARIPAGSFVMGSNNGYADEKPAHVVHLDEPFWLGTTEITNKQYAAFDPRHDSGVYDMRYKDQVDRGYYVNQPDKPVIRVSWERAMAFCQWLSKRTGLTVTLPTEAQWEWACRAGSGDSMFFGSISTDFSPFANLADLTTKELAVRGVNPKPIPNPHPLAAYLPAIHEANDKVLHLAPPATYRSNAWGLHDMHGNVAEWTRSIYRPYPYDPVDGRNAPDCTGAERVVRGGSWRERPNHATASYRWAYPEWQRVFNVGFRIAVIDSGDTPFAATGP